MANKAEGLPNPKKVKLRKKRKWIKLLIGISILGIVGGAIYFNKDKIAVYTKDIPVLNKIFLLSEIEQDPYAELKIEEIAQELQLANDKVEELNTALDTRQQEIDTLNTRIELLKEYEENYDDFEREKSEWDLSIAHSNPALFIEHFESVNLDLAQDIYIEFKEKEQWHKDYQKYANMIGSMDEVKAAEALEKLLTTEPILVKQIFEYMDLERQSLILSEMSTNGATQVIKLISPESQSN